MGPPHWALAGCKLSGYGHAVTRLKHSGVKLSGCGSSIRWNDSFRNLTLMNAAVVHTLGQPPRCEQFPDPVPAAGEVLVEVRAAALKPVDKQIAGGTHYASYRNLPAVCGTDGAGILEDG